MLDNIQELAVMMLALLQARTSSKRLPGKVMLPVLGKPLLELQIERVQQAKLIDKLVVATSTDSSDDKIADLCEKLGVEVYRGSLDDVLARFYHAANHYAADSVIRLTADCPLIDASLIDDMIMFYHQHNYDYVTNIVERTYPDGLDVDILSMDCLTKTYLASTLPEEREHITRYIFTRGKNDFKIAHYVQVRDLSKIRWTVDEHADYVKVKHIYETLYPKNKNFSTDDILALNLEEIEV